MKKALCIAINDYPGTDCDLDGCVNDARVWSNVLKKNDFNVSTLLNSEATGKNIISEITCLMESTMKGDSIVVVYSGHGSFVPDENGDEEDGTDECLCPYDVMENGPITDDELFNLSQDLKLGVRALMISDSCHSGTVAKFMPILTPPSIIADKPPQRKIKFLPPTHFLPKRIVSKINLKTKKIYTPPRNSNFLLMAGCQDVEYSYDAYFNGCPNGVFTFVAIKTLMKLDKNSTYSEWYKEIRKMLPSRQYPQTPNLFGSKYMKNRKIFY